MRGSFNLRVSMMNLVKLRRRPVCSVFILGLGLGLGLESSLMFGLDWEGFLVFSWSFGLDVLGLGRGSVVVFELGRELGHVAVGGVNVLGPVAVRPGLVPYGAVGTHL